MTTALLDFVVGLEFGVRMKVEGRSNHPPPDQMVETGRVSQFTQSTQ